jgi:hypothetical protein
MLEQLGVPDSFEGLVGIQIFKTRRWHLEPAIFQVAGPKLDGASLRVGELEDAYLQARALDAAWRKHILLWTVGAAKSLDAHLAEEMAGVRTDQTLQSRAFATLVGWRTESLPLASEADDPTWAPNELARGVQLRTELHLAIGRLAAVLAVGLGDLILDRVAQHSFWVAPSRDPTIVLGEFSASCDLSAPSSSPFPRSEVENWIASISSSPPWLYETLAEPLELIAAAKATEGDWVRFTLGWAALERIAISLGSRFDNSIMVEQRRCDNCGHPVTARKPTVIPRLVAVANAVGLPVRNELTRINRVRGRSHIGRLPEGAEAAEPERLAGLIVQRIIADPNRISV